MFYGIKHYILLYNYLFTFIYSGTKIFTFPTVSSWYPYTQNRCYPSRTASPLNSPTMVTHTCMRTTSRRRRGRHVSRQGWHSAHFPLSARAVRTHTDSHTSALPAVGDVAQEPRPQLCLNTPHTHTNTHVHQRARPSYIIRHRRRNRNRTPQPRTGNAMADAAAASAASRPRRWCAN